ncbi:UDP-glycosyltransferase 71A15 [Prunus yedoensis var. nudiflora]|uniref:UDP-glycosyltransferase 71A15 n=1 Tax=Prunus yedoensis var. nudiflora TaxID=2094558 RepID=A0A314ZC98_PRUYE|nr:UDP-glycosyltransferase 71A15 [Prunus yedoensis var. nudiflora]
MKRPAHLVFIPDPAIGHIFSTVEIAKQLVARDDHLFITVLLVTKLPAVEDDQHEYFITDNTRDSSVSSQQHISFVNLPEEAGPTTASSFSVVEDRKPLIRDAVAKLADSKATRLAGLVIDMLCSAIVDVANELGLPSYIFHTSNAASLGFLLDLQRLLDESGGKHVAELMGPAAELVVPSFASPVPTRVLPDILLDKEGAESFLRHARRFRETKGILVNSFLELEPHALRSLSDSQSQTPPVYPVGPLLNLKSNDPLQGRGGNQANQKSDIFDWLDDQPPSSVVFLCFGSMGSFVEAQVREIACALERTGLPFLWSLRQPPQEGKPSISIAMPKDHANPKSVLPQGFLDRTAGIGNVIGWAPQGAILAHRAIGGFESHCGWNSTLESLWYDVPVGAWPLYAEQPLNALIFPIFSRTSSFDLISHFLQ